MSNGKKIAIVTGGASGLGLAIAERLVSEGIFCVLIGRNEERLQEAKEQFKDGCAIYAFDLTDLEKLPDLVNQIKEDWGTIDILVNNAGIHIKKPILEVTNEDFQKVLLTNLTVVFALTREVGKIMADKGSGTIVNVSSMAAAYGIPQVIAYTAAKTGVEGMTRAMAVELSPLGIRVNCIAPGFIRTDMSAKAMDNDPERKRKVLSRTPMQSFGAPADVGDAAYFLVSDDSKFITGTVLTVDGGNSIGF